MTTPIRRAGVLTLVDGLEVLWAVADGRRGRRWRATSTREGAMTGSLLLEVGADGRFARLELATASGMLTLHPESDGMLYGNVVTPGGVRHLATAWSETHGVEVDPLVIASAITAHCLGPTVPTGEGRDVPVVVVALDLTIHNAVRHYRRIDASTWQIERADGPMALTLDARGVPVWSSIPGSSGGGAEWPLELHPHG